MLQNKPYSLTTRNGSKVVISVLLFSWLFTAGCDETFIPWHENDQYHFSIYGYLDATADTQWVRVMPVREDLFFEPKPIDATVTLKHVETGEMVVMKDSLFTDAHGRYAWNFWAPLKLQPDQIYSITAKRSDGKASHATVLLPPDYPTPIVNRIPRSPGAPPAKDIVYIEEAEQIVDVRSLHYLQSLHTGEEFMYVIPHLKDTTRLASGDYAILFDPDEIQRELNSFFERTTIRVTDRQIFIASAGPEFHHFPSIDDKIVALPDGVSNIVFGTGYLAGIVSKTIPYESCFREGSTDLIPCELLPPPW